MVYQDFQSSLALHGGSFGLSAMRACDDFSEDLERVKINDFMKMIFDDKLDHSSLFDFINSNKHFFGKSHTFEGNNGLTVGPLLTCSSFEDWRKKDFPGLCSAVRTIRNALSHGGEERKNDKVIVYTPKNMRLLKPYSLLARKIAESFVFM
jgi:hypothetical protein